MNGIDETTLAYAASLDAVVFLLVPLFLMTIVEAEEQRSLRYWAGGGAALATSSLLTAVFREPVPVWEVVASNALSVLGLGWMYIATKRLLGESASRWPPFALAGTIAATSLILTEVIPQPSLRVAVNSMLVAAYPAATAALLVRRRRVLTPLLALTTAGLFIAIALAYLSRAVSYLHVAADDDVAAAPKSVATLPLFLELVFSTWLGAMLAIIVSARIQSSLRRERDLVTAANRRLAVMSTTDPLTGLANRNRIDTVLQETLTGNDPGPISLIMIDVDHFKRINDDFGHPIGDEVLVRMADVLRSGVRDADTVGRWGGEEFIVVLPDTAADGAEAIAERIRGAVAAADFGIGRTVTASLGLSERQGQEDPVSLVARADGALYEAKRAGRNRVLTA